MANVHGVRGEFPAGDLGMCDMNDHVVYAKPGWEFSPEAQSSLHRPDAFTAIEAELSQFKAAGGGAIVDLTGIGEGRIPQFSADLSAESGVNIVAATGFGPERDILTYFRSSLESFGSLTKPAVYQRDIDYVTGLFVQELTEGMGTTTVPAGVITVAASGDGFTELEQMLHRAAARACNQTGAAIITTGIQSVERQVELLLEEKVDPERVVLAVADAPGSSDLERDTALVQQGFSMLYSHVGPRRAKTDAGESSVDQADLLLSMIERGFCKQLAVGSGGVGWNVGRLDDGESYAGPRDLVTVWAEILQGRGVTERQWETLVVANPQRILAY